MLILFVLLINSGCNRVCFYLSGTYYSQFCTRAFGRFSWPGLRGRHVCVFSCSSHILTIWWEKALHLEHFLTAGLSLQAFFLSNSSLHSALKSHWMPAQQCFNFWILKPAGMTRMEYFKQQKTGSVYVACKTKALWTARICENSKTGEWCQVVEKRKLKDVSRLVTTFKTRQI